MLRRIFPDRRDPRVHEFSDLTHSDQACAEGCDDELLEAPQGIEILLHRYFCSACTLNLLLPLLPVRSNTPPLPCAPFLQPPLRVSSPSSPCPLPPTATVSTSIPCLQA